MAEYFHHRAHKVNANEASVAVVTRKTARYTIIQACSDHPQKRTASPSACHLKNRQMSHKTKLLAQRHFQLAYVAFDKFTPSQ